jgi:L-seryl-tRNA(Ser) seleniumtransferase
VPDAEIEDRLRALPSVEQLLQTEPLRSVAARSARPVAVTAAREQIERTRSEVREGNGTPSIGELAAAAAAELERSETPNLEAVINATGVVVHTNLGRAPLASTALEAIERLGRGYSNLEYDLAAGARRSRHAHVEKLICQLTGAEAGFAVNNNAAAVLLAFAALAHDREVVISRGQLVEIGGSFRIPEILGASGARLVEVGTTNRTRLDDYRRAIGEQTAALVRVHTSNFRTLGFTEEVGIGELCVLARERGVLVIDDLGSGVVSDWEGSLAALAREEPAARDSIGAGADVVCFSGDKLLGGPQAGLICGRRGALERMRAHPLARAVRIDKLSLAALEATLRLHRDPARAARELPVLRMLSATEDELSARAARLAEGIAAAGAADVSRSRAAGRVGGGALPLVELEGPVVVVRPRGGGVDGLQARLRAGRPPVVARVQEDALVLDPRTIRDDQVELLAAAVSGALR